MKTVFWILTALMTNASYASHDDTTRVKQIVQYFQQGHFYGQIRHFTMATINDGALNDYYAGAMGASVHYETKPWKGFRLGLNGLFVYRTFSNDLLAIDSTTGKSASYEKQLFDVEHPGNYSDLDRLEELYLAYNWKNWETTVGKMEVETPIVNKHDGRMKPKVFSGIKSSYQTDSLRVLSAWFWKASPRSITHWYTISETIGLYNNGCLPDGSPANYHHFIDTKGMGVLGVQFRSKKKLRFSLWDYLIENVSNTTLVNLEYNDSLVTSGFMYLNQNSVKFGGNPDPEFTYFNPALTTHALSGRFGIKLKNHALEFNATHVFEGGMFLFPREMGMDPFYTFISRSQMEGFGDASAFTVGYFYRPSKWQLQLYWNHLLVSENLRYNKYDIPSYHQFNIDLNYSFSKLFEGLELRFLYVYRMANSSALSVSQTFNKVNFHQVNAILNYNF